MSGWTSNNALSFYKIKLWIIAWQMFDKRFPIVLNGKFIEEIKTIKNNLEEYNRNHDETKMASPSSLQSMRWPFKWLRKVFSFSPVQFTWRYCTLIYIDLLYHLFSASLVEMRT